MPDLYQHPKDPDPAHPFEHDRLGRVELANKLTKMLTRLPKGAVFSIDAPWGDGKSWFGRNWHSQLTQNGYKSAYIDTFSADYMEDPFFLLSGELSTAFQQGKKSEIKKSAVQVAKAIAPVVAKVLINGAGKMLGAGAVANDIGAAISNAGEIAAESAETILTDKITDYESEKSSISQFKKSLEALAKSNFDATGKPMIVFMDELDRCRPDFAVKAIERIKHFFDVPHLIFILLLNSSQIEESIRGVYGPNIDAERYIGKFIQFTISLPREVGDGHKCNERFILQKLMDYGFGAEARLFTEPLANCAYSFKLTLRDIERCIILLSLNALGQKINNHFACFITSMKVSHPKYYRAIIERRSEYAQETANLLHATYPGYMDFIDAISTCNNAIKTNSTIDYEKSLHYARTLGIGHANVIEGYISAFQSFNLKID